MGVHGRRTHTPEFDQIIGIIYFHLFYRENFDDILYIYNSKECAFSNNNRNGCCDKIMFRLLLLLPCYRTMVHVVFDDVTVQRQDNRANGVFVGV